MITGLRRSIGVGALLLLGLARPVFSVSAAESAARHEPLRVGGPAQLAPYAYLDSSGVYTGFSVDFLHFVGQKLKTDNVLFFPANPSESLRMLAAGNLDCIHCVRYSSALAQNYSFAAFYLESPSVMFVLQDRYDVSTLQDLRGKRVAVLGDDPAEARLRQLSGVRVVEAEGLEKAFALLSKRKIDAFVGERLTTLRFLSERRLSGKVKMIGREIAWSRFGILVRKDQTNLARRLNQAVLQAERSGDKKRIFKQWFGEDVQPQIPLTHRVIRWVFVFVGSSLLLAMIVLGWNLLLQRELELKAIAVEKAELDRTIAEEKSRFEAVVQSMTEGLMLVDPEGKIAYLNASGAQYFGRQSAEWPGRPLTVLNEHLFSQIKDHSTLKLKLEQAEQNPTRPVVIEYVLMTTRRQDIRLKIFPVRDRQDRFAGRGILIQDLTHEREVERLKSEFVSIASHELRTPMTSILGFSELMLTQELPRDLNRRYAEQIHAEAERLTRILNDMLDISYLESGEGVLERKPVAISELVWEVVDAFRAQLHDRRELRVMGDGMALTVLADRDKLTQVLWNLLSNADKYSPPGKEVVIEIWQRHAPSPGWNMIAEEAAMLIPAVELKITDFGQGIPADQLSVIFLPFHRVETAVHTIRGTGLGLAIVKRIVEAHGGKVWAKSRLGEETVFTVVLPIQHPTATQGV